jgi:hypothetical protein
MRLYCVLIGTASVGNSCGIEHTQMDCWLIRGAVMVIIKLEVGYL